MTLNEETKLRLAPKGKFRVVFTDMDGDADNSGDFDTPQEALAHSQHKEGTCMGTACVYNDKCERLSFDDANNFSIVQTKHTTAYRAWLRQHSQAVH